MIDADGHAWSTRRAAPRTPSSAPYHVERGKIFVRHRCARTCRPLDAERIAPRDRADPLPSARRTRTMRRPTPRQALVRAADLIGQLGDPDLLCAS